VNNYIQKKINKVMYKFLKLHPKKLPLFKQKIRGVKYYFGEIYNLGEITN